MKAFLFITMLVLLLGLGVFAQAQSPVQNSEPTMILTGAVYDINGAVIVNGTKIAAYSSGGKRYETTTNEEGIYKIQLPLATYKIEASAPGFCSERMAHFRVVNSTYGKMSLDFVLEVADNQPDCKQEVSIGKQSQRKIKRKLEIIE
jgi:Carboxypeptidase regulatory-like domain